MKSLRSWSFARVVLVSVGWVVLCVLLFRRGIVGEIVALSNRWRGGAAGEAALRIEQGQVKPAE